MKWFTSVLSLMVVALGLAACQPAADPPPQRESLPGAADGETSAVGDLAALLAALAESGVLAEETQDAESAGLFDITPQVIAVNGTSVEVYEFADEAAQEAAATIPDLMARTRWAATPHFWASGRLIVLYVGDEANMVGALNAVLGDEFDWNTPVES